MDTTASDKIVSLQIPLAFQHFLPKDLLDALPSEKYATCSDCVMCGTSCSSSGSLPFNSATKCCTYFPDLPNYCVGGILGDLSLGGAEGRARVEKAILSRRDVYPTGIFSPDKYNHLYELSKRKAFGRSTKLLCPYFSQSNGSCTIWKFRNATCSTWFCKYEDGRDGMAFWESIQTFLSRIERALAIHILQELGFSADRILSYKRSPTRVSAHLAQNELDESPINSIDYENVWGDWCGRERELFTSAFEIVSGLTYNDVARLGGVELNLQYLQIKERSQQLSKKAVPIRLIQNPKLTMFRQPSGSFLVVSYSGNDPTLITSDLYHALAHIDGEQPWEDQIEILARSKGIVIDAKLIILLYRKRILVDPIHVSVLP